LDRGTLAVVDNLIDQATGTIRLKATFANAHDRLWPGQFVTARVLLRTERGALTIPAAAVQRGPEGEFAYLVRPDGTVAAQPIATGEESASTVVVEKGLTEGARVVTSNQFRLQPGARIRILQAQDPAGGAR
ncbi:MAG: efflux RND transporter periplasmic adaptor subunit, partial [Burkholderiales bacterium]